jgi:hypothetical protein
MMKDNLLISVDVYLNEDNSDLRATAVDANGREVCPDYTQFIDHILHRSMWLFTESKKLPDNEDRAIFNITLFESGRVTTKWDTQWLDKLSQHTLT